jgi:hypothetical protein
MPPSLTKNSAAKTLPFILFALAMLALAGCGASVAGVSLVNGTTVGLGGAAAGVLGTRPDDPPPADLADQTAQHENWCYETMGYNECYAQPQKVDPNRLVNVDPANRYPLTPRAYDQAVFEAQ